MGNKTWFLLSVMATLGFVALLVFGLQSPGLPLRLIIAALVATGSIAAARKRLIRRNNSRHTA